MQSQFNDTVKRGNIQEIKQAICDLGENKGVILDNAIRIELDAYGSRVNTEDEWLVYLLDFLVKESGKKIKYSNGKCVIE